MVQQFIINLKNTSLPEFIGVITGIGSVYFSKKENILVYPVGMISTIIFTYLYLTHQLYADASVNLYYTVMSIIGWVMWSKKKDPSTNLVITKSSGSDWKNAILFFVGCWVVLYIVLSRFTDSTVPIADSFTSAAAFTGMLLMNKKKIENWFWWIITNIASIPLNAYKGLYFASLQYIVLLVIAISGWRSWWLTWKASGKIA
jgi:nicotinamide mononucleotide transporter